MVFGVHLKNKNVIATYIIPCTTLRRKTANIVRKVVQNSSPTKSIRFLSSTVSTAVTISSYRDFWKKEAFSSNRVQRPWLIGLRRDVLFSVLLGKSFCVILTRRDQTWKQFVEFSTFSRARLINASRLSVRLFAQQ